MYFDWESIYHSSRMPPGYYLEIHSARDIDSTVHMTAVDTRIFKTGLAKKSIHSTTWQFKTMKKSFKERLKAFVLTPDSKLVVPSSIPLSQNLK